jgi:hypothetical protein
MVVSAVGDERLDFALAQRGAVDLVVIAAVGQEPGRSAIW